MFSERIPEGRQGFLKVLGLIIQAFKYCTRPGAGNNRPDTGNHKKQNFSIVKKKIFSYLPADCERKREKTQESFHFYFFIQIQCVVLRGDHSGEKI